MPPKGVGILISATGLEGLETVFVRTNVLRQPSAIGKGECVAVIVINTLNNMDLTANNTEVMVGGENGQPHQLLPGERSELIYTPDLENVYARVRDTLIAGDPPEIDPADPVDVTLIIYRKRRE